MKLASRTVAAGVPARHAQQPLQPAPAPVHALPAVLLAMGAIVLLYHATFLDMMQVWSRSQTFAHGYLIVPISIWLAWRQRAQLAAMRPAPSRTGLLLLAGLGLAWLLAHAAYVQAVEQYAATAMLPASLLAILGWPAARALAFPLAYLFLAVPFGEVFLPPLIDFTAGFTVGALQLSGLPVFRDGNYFSLPTGNWSVVEACSGLRYVIASLALGALFAHLHFRTPWRRAVILACAVLVPILANGVRAWLIVMLGHHSDMRLAVGVDHLIYGWLFFGAVALLLLLLASRWRERPLPPQGNAAIPITRPAPHGARKAAAACVLIAAVWPALALRDKAEAVAAKAQQGQVQPAVALDLPAPAGWRLDHTQRPDWSAVMAGAPVQFYASYRQDPGQGQAGAQASLQLAWYAHQARDAELLTHQVAPFGPRWLPVAQQTRHVTLDGRDLPLRETLLAHGGQRVLVWRSYRQGGVPTANPALVKLLLARARLLDARQDGADIMVSAPYDELSPPPRAQLQAFLQAVLPAIEQRLQALQELHHAP